ncbi:hypothetical protein [Methylopila turkensis]|uniref:Uncharacterized protein n=1 Tax=Methylopila turkensis TaxID=1437816 RepID=A0A9W6JRJ7_9HYPH|nr:hypothetical protein [Methylopila turkensis]GLK80479.1 hypothetical protein GCM10008174_22200 [Methylopila turkensis]
MTADAPEVAAAIAARRTSLDRQSVAAALGMAVVALIFTYDGADHDRTVQGMIDILPWLVGLSLAIFAFNRWTLSIQSKLIRREFDGAAARSAAPPRHDRSRKNRN